jgi:gliding motility-associated-like protein
MLQRTPALYILFLLLSLYTRAAVFTVTTNADSGPGSLRDAITQAAANGVLVQDNIVFNISDLTEPGRTIDLQSELPALSANLVLDGSTQPGAVFGISGAKIKLVLSHIPTPSYFTCLLVQDAINVEIYGLYLSFIFDPRSSGGDLYGIRIKNSSNITIGAPGKGNVVSGWFWDITNQYWNYFLDYSNTISLKGNIVGLSEFGKTQSIITNPIAILLSNTYNIVVGGIAPGEGNQIFGDAYGIQTNHRDPSIPGSFFIKLINNKILTDPTGTIPYYGGYIAAVELNGTPVLTTDTNIVKTTVINNVISGTYTNKHLLLENIRHLVKVMGNRFGTDITGTNQIGSSTIGIFAYGCYKVLVGSDDPADINYFAGNEIGVFNGGTPHLLITKNSFFCNGTGISISGWPGPNPKPFVTINTYTATLISGKSNPMARIEIFQNHNCPYYYGSCQGKTYVTTVYADNSGNWSYSGPQPSALIMTATTTDSVTSEFPVPALSQQGKTFVQPTCGKSNGSISGMKVINGTYFKWVDQSGNIVGTDTNLVNLKPGTYTLYVSFGENGCSVNSDGITLQNIQPPPTLTVQPLDPTCGQRNGQLFYYGDLNGLEPRVVNQLGDTIFNHFQTYLNAGTYRLIAYPPGDFSCAVTYGPYTLTNQSGPVVDMSTAVITSASCHASNGSIRNLSIANVSGSSFYRWTDVLGNTIGNGADLVNVPPGKYQLKFKDGGGCDTITTDLFTVGDQGSITIDTTAMLIAKSKCSVNSGSIQNLIVQNGSSYQWFNMQTGSVTGSSKDLMNMASGTYQLLVTNASGCNSRTGNIFIPQETAAPVTAGFIMKPESCNRKDGSLNMNSFSANASDYTFEWKTNTGVIVGNNQVIQNLDSGYYSLYATDPNGCKQVVSTQHICAAPAPLIANAILSPEICGEKNGSINLNVKGSSPFSYAWSDVNGPLPNGAASLDRQSSGAYSVIITDINNCSTNGPAYIIKDSTVLPDPPEYKNLIILKGNSATLTPVDPAYGNYSLFNFEGAGTAIEQNGSGIFTTGTLLQDTTLFISLTRGTCSSPLTGVKIKVVTTILIEMPNAFTPNHDGHNDLFRVKYPDVIKTFRMDIYNRWGQSVYSTEDPYKGWNGAVGGLDQPVGGYIWKILYTDVFGNTQQINGTVLLIR